jgi:hypothetical protein
MSETAEIRPFRIDIPQADLDDLHGRFPARPLARAVGAAAAGHPRLAELAGGVPQGHRAAE